jgi:hypothetical protein
MSVMSRIAIWLLPRRVTNARQGLEGSEHEGWARVGVGLGVREAFLGDDALPTVCAGVELQADASSAMTANARIPAATLVVMQR